MNCFLSALERQSNTHGKSAVWKTQNLTAKFLTYGNDICCVLHL